MPTYVKGDAVANAETYELYEKISAGTTLGDAVEYLPDWATCKGSLGNTNYFALKNTWESKVHVNKFRYYNGGSDTISATVLLYDADSMLITKAFSFDSVVAGENNFDVDFDVEPNENFIVRVSKASYYLQTPTGYPGITIVTADKYSVGGTVTAGASFPQYSICASFAGNEYVVISETGYEKKATASEINFEVSALGLTAGEHTFVVKAKANGYEDSDYSNEVVFTQT